MSENTIGDGDHRRGSVLGGALLLGGAHIVAGALLWSLPLGEWGATLLATIGVSQLVYGLPIALWLRHRGRSAALKGVLLMMGISLCLNAACWGVAAVELGPH